MLQVYTQLPKKTQPSPWSCAAWVKADGLSDLPASSKARGLAFRFRMDLEQFSTFRSQATVLQLAQEHTVPGH